MSMFVISEALLAEKRTGEPRTPSAPTLDASWYETAKVVLDFSFALLLLILTAPLMLFAIILIKFSSPGPALYTQTRLGKNGRPFTIFKLRTMTHNCESLTGARWSMPGDSRVTGIGRWLRKTHIDELPQLWNVIRGDMSLIGPRPERPEFCPQLEQAIALYRERLRVRPGVTGFAQVQLPPDTDFESVRVKLAYDLRYIHACGLWFDLRIYFATFFKILGLPLDTIGNVCFFPHRDAVEAGYWETVATK